MDDFIEQVFHGGHRVRWVCDRKHLYEHMMEQLIMENSCIGGISRSRTQRYLNWIYINSHELCSLLIMEECPLSFLIFITIISYFSSFLFH